MVSIGSKKEDAKVININIKIRHIVLGIVLALLLLYVVTDREQLFNYQVTCPSGYNQTIDRDTLFICNEFVPQNLNTRDKIHYYNENYIENGK